jgi:hypothetical protein
MLRRAVFVLGIVMLAVAAVTVLGSAAQAGGLAGGVIQRNGK